MDELDLVRRFYGDVSDTDDPARTQARRNLRKRFGHHPRFIRWATVAAALGVAITATLVGTFEDTQPRALRTLHALAVVATDLDLAAGAEPIVYERASLRRIQVGTGINDGSYRFLVKSQREIWRSPGGTALSKERVIESDPLTPEDQRIWESLDRPPVPERGDIIEESETDLPLPDLTGLPSEPDALIEAIQGRWTAEQIDSDVELLGAIGEMLARGDASPELRADLFRAAAEIPGIELLGPMRDPLDREGVGIALGPPDRRVTLVVDPNTSILLSVSESRKAAGVSVSGWIAYSGWATVPEIGDRPASSEIV